MTESTATVQYILEKEVSVPAVRWIELEQAEIPLDQERATKGDIYAMLNIAAIGQSARSYRSGRCPVARKFSKDGIVVSTRVQFYVHRSTNFNYTIEPSEGVLSSNPVKVFRQKKDHIKTEYNEQFRLGWNPVKGSFVGNFSTDCYDKKRRLVKRPEVIQDDGFVYVKGAVWAVFSVSGTAWCDKWTLTINHQQGERFAREIFVDAVWYEGNVRKYKRLKLKLSGCVVDEFNKCPYGVDPNDLTGDGQGDGSDFWDVRVNYSSAVIVYSQCDGSVLKIYEDEEI